MRIKSSNKIKLESILSAQNVKCKVTKGRQISSGHPNLTYATTLLLKTYCSVFQSFWHPLKTLAGVLAPWTPCYHAWQNHEPLLLQSATALNTQVVVMCRSQIWFHVIECLLSNDYNDTARPVDSVVLNDWQVNNIDGTFHTVWKRMFSFDYNWPFSRRSRYILFVYFV